MPAAPVDVAEHGLVVLLVHRLRQVHDMHAGSGHVVHAQEFPPGCSCAPDDDAGCLVNLGFVTPADERRDDMGVFRMVIVAMTEEVSGHDAAVAHYVALDILTIVAFAELYVDDLDNGVGLVSVFKRIGERGVFPHRRGGQFGVDATGTKNSSFWTRLRNAASTTLACIIRFW